MQWLFFVALAITVPDKSDPDKNPLPLEATKTIEFSTDEGTWISIDLSPDGRTMVFDLLGDLYTLPIEGGEAKRIFGGISFESQPRFSPDGSTIAFLSDRSGVENLWLIDNTGANPRPVSKDEPTKARPQSMASPSWTPDGNYLLVSKSRPPERTYSVFMYHRDGGTGVRVGPAPPPATPPVRGAPRAQHNNQLGAVASPDGRFIYYGQRQGSFNYNAQFPIWQIVRFNRETSETATITNAQGSAMRPLISPDGKHLVYGTRYRTNTGLRVRELSTGSERWLIYPVTRDDQESRATRDTMPGYAFTPDGRALVLSIGGKIHRVDFATGSSSQIPFNAQIKAEIGPRIHFSGRVNDSEKVRARVIRWPRLSPDKNRIAFSAFNRVWTMNLPNGEPKRLTQLETGEFMPSWSPDGKHITFVTWSLDGGHIYRASIGTSPERLTQKPAFYADPVYTPSGKDIVFITGTREDQLYSNLNVFQEKEIGGVRPSGTMDLRIISATGGPSTLIAATDGGRFPHFANDQNRVYLTTSKGLASIRLDGFDRKLHVQFKGTGPGPTPPAADEVILSPDGVQAFVNIQNKHYVVAIPRAGQETLTLDITPAGDAAVPVKKLSRYGGNYLGWSRDGNEVFWSQGATFYRQILGSSSNSTNVVVELPRPRPKGTLVLKGASRIITMEGDEILKGNIVVVDNRISAIGENIPYPATATVIDISGQTVMPGLVDAHAHMWAPRQVHQTQVWHYLANLAYGVTTTRDPQTSTDDVFSYADLVESGEIIGPRIYATGPGIFSTSGVDDQMAADSFLERYAKAYDARTIKQYVVGDRVVRQWIAIASRKHQLTPTTEGALDLKLDLTQMADGYSGHEHSLPIVPIYKDVANYVAKTETYYTPTMLVAYGGPWSENYFFQNTNIIENEKVARFIPYQLLDNMTRRRSQWFAEDEYIFPQIAAGCAKIVNAGGKCCLGSHGQLQGISAHWETWALQSGGLSEHQTLRAVTLHSAEAIGLNRDIGSLKTGKLADIIVLDKNPLDDIRNTNSVRYVIKNGEVFQADTLDQVWPEKKPLPQQFWWDDRPEHSNASGQTP